MKVGEGHERLHVALIHALVPVVAQAESWRSQGELAQVVGTLIEVDENDLAVADWCVGVCECVEEGRWAAVALPVTHYNVLLSRIIKVIH